MRFKNWLNEYTAAEAEVSAKKISDQAASLIKKHGKKAERHADDGAVKAEIRRQLNKLISPKSRFK